jgi:hypothetical protein
LTSEKSWRQVVRRVKPLYPAWRLGGIFDGLRYSRQTYYKYLKLKPQISFGGAVIVKMAAAVRSRMLRLAGKKALLPAYGAAEGGWNLCAK